MAFDCEDEGRLADIAFLAIDGPLHAMRAERNVLHRLLPPFILVSNIDADTGTGWRRSIDVAARKSGRTFDDLDDTVECGSDGNG